MISGANMNSHASSVQIIFSPTYHLWKARGTRHHILTFYLDRSVCRHELHKIHSTDNPHVFMKERKHHLIHKGSFFNYLFNFRRTSEISNFTYGAMIALAGRHEGWALDNHSSNFWLSVRARIAGSNNRCKQFLKHRYFFAIANI